MKKEEKAPAIAQASEVRAKKNASDDYFADFNFADFEVSMELLMKGGVHFGHQKSRKHPKMNEYVFTTKQGISIIDLQKTLEKMEEAAEFVRKLKQEGKNILFVGTKKQAKDLVRSVAVKCEMPYVVERWLGGTFTNFKSIKKRTKYLRDLEEKIEKGELKKYTKLEQLKKREEAEKMEVKMGGIKKMEELPGAIFVTDIKEDDLAIKEAIKIGIPVIAIADTNVDPSVIDYPIPGNDDAISSLRVILSYFCKQILAGK